MGFRKFLDRLLNGSKTPEAQIFKRPAYFEEPTGYYTVRGDEFADAYSDWLKTKSFSHQRASELGSVAFITNLDNRSGYVREFCLRAIAIHAWPEAFKPAIQRLNDYVPSNRALALDITLKYLEQLPLAAVIDALPELDSLAEKTRASSEPVHKALGQRLGNEAGQEALVWGLTHTRAMVRRACWSRCMQTLGWSGPERIQAALRCGDPSIARSVETDVFALSDGELKEWFHKLGQVRAMPLRRAFLVAMRRRELVDSQNLISIALLDDSFSIRWLGRHWGKDDPKGLMGRYEDVLRCDSSARHMRYALEGLGDLKMPEGLEACKRVLNHSSPALRKAALAAVCVIDASNEPQYVADAIQDAELMVVREAFRLMIGANLPLPMDAITKAASTRRNELPFFELILDCAKSAGFWDALHLASCLSLAAPTLQLELTLAIGNFLNGLSVCEVYVAPTKEQWKAIRAWMPVDTLVPNSGLRQVLDFYAYQMEN